MTTRCGPWHDFTDEGPTEVGPMETDPPLGSTMDPTEVSTRATTVGLTATDPPLGSPTEPTEVGTMGHSPWPTGGPTEVGPMEAGPTEASPALRGPTDKTCLVLGAVALSPTQSGTTGHGQSVTTGHGTWSLTDKSGRVHI
jgi:hypothetical protein